jgi:mono/diheme cytochrome c family protein
MRRILLMLALVAGCRGNVSSEAPIRVNPNMFQQERFDTQEPNPWFEDGRAMRPEVPGTVAVGQLNEDDHLYRGVKDGKPALELPMRLDRKLLERGRDRFNIYCAMCHDRAGTGDGIVVRKGMLPPPSFADPRLRALPVGQLFQIVSRGVRNMPSYAAQIPVQDRWAIVGYVRALQVARGAKLPDVPPDVRDWKGWSQ